jgi:uncharacterized Zn-binding protein involved in type VI secretion
MVTGVVPHVGGPILPPGVPTVLIDFLPAATVTDMATCVGPPDMIVMGSTGVFINFLPAARLGDPTVHGGVITLGSPTCIIGEVGAPSPGAAGAAAVVAGLAASGLLGQGVPTKTPSECLTAPQTVTIPKDVNQSFDNLMQQSYPKGRSQEHGGMLVANSEGNITLVNQGGGKSGSFAPDRTLPAGCKEVGLFHTHPYDATEHSYTGVSFSGADIAIAANRSEPSYVQSGDTQFLMLPTQKTPKGINVDALNKSQNLRIRELTRTGKSFPEASRLAANETAKKYGMAYYEGSHGTLNRLSC